MINFLGEMIFEPCPVRDSHLSAVTGVDIAGQSYSLCVVCGARRVWIPSLGQTGDDFLEAHSACCPHCHGHTSEVSHRPYTLADDFDGQFAQCALDESHYSPIKRARHPTVDDWDGRTITRTITSWVVMCVVCDSFETVRSELLDAYVAAHKPCCNRCYAPESLNMLRGQGITLVSAATVRQRFHRDPGCVPCRTAADQRFADSYGKFFGHRV